MLDPMTALHQLMVSFRDGVDTVSQMLAEEVAHEARIQLVELIDTVDKIQSLAIDAQKEHIALAAAHLKLTSDNVKLQQSANRFRGYCLHEARPGVYVYAAHDLSSPPKASQWKCRQCEDDGVSAPLEYDGAAWRCRYCSFVV